ncbi:putative Hydroxyproline-rich glycoprotein family protein [Quillaja saponaria]|uniref:Hydroxyproline-rich glycoprotein family protein n=1 Tax=Quillaja saponaria TaxID=32244 RepID=A0AAD7KVC8_QUISA|nr:putative Hydroxyproline-rich glycoprotein family protein [Quillaja saponaria]
MKTTLRKLRGLALHKPETRDRRDIRPLAQWDELAQATQDMQDMRDCYDSLLSAAAATANSAYEFSESLQEMGSCLLEKTALNDDEESGKVLLLLGKLQFELQKLVDSYRSHIFKTITIPSESLLNELRTLEEMKLQCDEKRNVYEYMITGQRDRGRSRGRKAESFSIKQLETACDEYDEEATLFVFRLKSLKQGQSRSLLTQAARHHAAQLSFFKKALKSLEAVEPHVKSATGHHHIDYQFSGLNDDVRDDCGDGDDSDNGYDENDDRELSFDYGKEKDVIMSRNTKELDQVELTFPQVSMVEAVKENLDRLPRNSFSFRARGGSQSAPLFAENKHDPNDKLRQPRPSLSRKFNTYVLPTPVDAKSSTASVYSNTVPSKMPKNSNERTNNLWHSSPLEPKKFEKLCRENNFSGPVVRTLQSVLKESNNNTTPTKLPPPLADGPHHDLVSASDSKKIKRQAFSGPLTSKPWRTRPASSEHFQLFSGPLLRKPMSQPSSSPKVSPSASPTFMSSPNISELHELPRPPTSFASKSSRPLNSGGHSVQVVSRVQVLSATNKLALSSAASPLPTPPQNMVHSFSIPSSGVRAVELVSKPLEAPHQSVFAEDLASPPLTPIVLSSNKPSSNGSGTVT